MANPASDVLRIVFQVILEGDLLKMNAVSNVAETGGGARDLRFRPSSAFLPLFQRMFPETVPKRRNSTMIEINTGTVFWNESGSERSETMSVWPPTNARPNECRIARISSFGYSPLVESDPQGGKSLFMLFQLRNRVVRAYFTTETSLRSDEWDFAVKDFVHHWFSVESGNSRSHPKYRSAFIDFETNERYPV